MANEQIKIKVDIDLGLLYAKGYRWLVEFEESSNICPLAVKTMPEIGPLVRLHYPNEKNYCAFELRVSLGRKWTRTNCEDFYDE